MRPDSAGTSSSVVANVSRFFAVLLIVCVAAACSDYVRGPYSPISANSPQFRSHLAWEQAERAQFDATHSRTTYYPADYSSQLMFDTDFRSNPNKGLSRVHFKDEPGSVSGYVDSNCRFITHEALRSSVEQPVFNEGLAVVTVCNPQAPRGWGPTFRFINGSGQFVFHRSFRYAGNFEEGLAVVHDEQNRWFLMHHDGTTQQINWKSPIVGIDGFVDGLAAVRTKNGTGFIDTTGRFVIPPKFFGAGSFSSGDLTWACVARRACGFINRAGKFVIAPRYAWVKQFTEGFAPVRKGMLWGFINQRGMLAITPQFYDVDVFSEGLCAVAVDQYRLKRGYIDTSGRMVIEPQFYEAGPFKFGIAGVALGGPGIGVYRYIDTSGRFIFGKAEPYVEI